jgi:hypothetical protein
MFYNYTYCPGAAIWALIWRMPVKVLQRRTGLVGRRDAFLVRFSEIRSLIARLRTPPAPALRALSEVRRTMKGRGMPRYKDASRFSVGPPSTAGFRSPFACGDGELPCSTPSKGTIVTSKPPRSWRMSVYCPILVLVFYVQPRPNQ